MATPYSWSNSSGALSSGPSRTLLQQLLEEINGASSPRKVRNESPSQSPASTRSWSSSQNHSPSVWVGGSSSAQDARDKLRAADEARQRMVAVNNIDGASDMQTPTLRLDTSGLEMQETTLDEYGRRPVSGSHRTPDPVRHPHDYMQHMMKGSPLSMTVGLSPAAQGHDDIPFHLQASPFDNAVPQPLSPLIFNDVYFDDSSSLSPQTETTASPTEAPTSAATVYTAEEPRTPSIDGTRKRTHFFDDSTPEVSPQKRRTVTLPDIRSDVYSKMAIDAHHCFIGVGGDNRCVLRDETFTERAATPRVSIDLSTKALPELSSFRPTVVDPQGQPQLNIPPQRPARSFTSPVESASPAVPDTPAWMRPMHLIDTGGKSIYMNAHDDGPIRHALCLYCFRTHGDFRKVHRHGYESCGRTEVLDSHYWESDTWPEDSSDDSTSSDR